MRSAMKIVFALWLVFTVSVGGYSQPTAALSGRISFGGSPQHPVEARVEIHRLGVRIQEQVTSDGRFEFVDLTPGSYTVIVYTAAYETVTREVHLPDEFQIWVELQPRRRVYIENSFTAAVTDYQVPKSARRQFAEAQKKARANNCPGALEHLKKALDIFAQYADAQNAMGNCYVVLGQLELAEDAFKQAVSLTPSVYPTLNLSDLYVRQGRLQDAEDVLTTAIRHSPHEGDAYYGLALLRFAQNRLEEAAQLCVEAHQRPHRVADIHLLLAKIYLGMEKKTSAVGELELYVRESKPNPVREQVVKFLEELRR